MKVLSQSRHFQSFTGSGIVAVFSVLTYRASFRFLPEATKGNWVFSLFAFLLLGTFQTRLLPTELSKFYVGANIARQHCVTGSAWCIGLLIAGIFWVFNVTVLVLIGPCHKVRVLVVAQWLLALANNAVPAGTCLHFTRNIYGAACASVFTSLASTAYSHLALRRSVPINFWGVLGLAAVEARGQLRAIYASYVPSQSKEIFQS